MNKSLISIIGLGIAWAIFLFAVFFQPINEYLITPLASVIRPLNSLNQNQIKNYSREVFGFLPYWNFHNADNIDFETLTTLAYFDIKVQSDGSIIKDDAGYTTFISNEATAIFKKAHKHGTRVVLTLSLMDNEEIKTFLDNEEAQAKLISESVRLVEDRGIDGINIDFEYEGDAGDSYRNRFTGFVDKLTKNMHTNVESSQVTVSVYASGVKYPKVQNIGDLSRVSDGIFMMGYDFAMASSDVAMPTAPLGGHKEGKYWYDITTAVEDFLTVMPANKLILGTPWYGLNFEVYEPGFKAETVSWYYWGKQGEIQTYDKVKQNVKENRTDESTFKTGWDEISKVSWAAYYTPDTDTWRMVYMDDPRSLGAKYDFAKEKKLLGVGIWALGYEGEHQEMWDVVKIKFGNKIADIRISQKQIYELL